MKTILRIFLFLAVFAGMTYSVQAQRMPLGPYGQIPFRTGNVGVGTGAVTLTLDQMRGGLLTSTITGATTYTTPTATALCTLFPFLAAQNANNFSYDWYVKNTAASSIAITLAGGSGVTLVGTGTAAQSALRHFKVVFTSCGATPAVQLISLETTAF